MIASGWTQIVPDSTSSASNAPASPRPMARLQVGLAGYLMVCQQVQVISQPSGAA
jgi:hypothetical protein